MFTSRVFNEEKLLEFLYKYLTFKQKLFFLSFSNWLKLKGMLILFIFPGLGLFYFKTFIFYQNISNKKKRYCTHLKLQPDAKYKMENFKLM